MFTVKYNRNTVHIDGIADRTNRGGLSYALTACASLSRYGRNMARGGQFEHLVEAVADARKHSSRSFCLNCEKAAMAAVEELAADSARIADVADMESGDFARVLGETGEFRKVTTWDEHADGKIRVFWRGETSHYANRDAAPKFQVWNLEATDA